MSDQAAETLITDEMRSLIGRPLRTATSFPISVSDIRKWAIAVYYPAMPPRLYWDEEYAATTKWGGIIAPQEFNPMSAPWMTVDPPPAPPPQWGKGDKAPRKAGDFELEAGVTPPPHRAVLQSRVIATYGATPLRPGDVIHSVASISEYWERPGKMGLQLYTTISDDHTNQAGQWIKRLDTVYVRYR